MVECLLVMLELSTQVTHPVNIEFASADVEGSRVVSFAKGLALSQAIKNAVHWHLGFELLISRPDTLN